MQNCLRAYQESCASGRAAVFSIREAATGERVACISVERRTDAQGKCVWTLGQLAGRRNSRVDGLADVARRIVARVGNEWLIQ